MQTISIRQVQGGWSVETSLNPFPLAFLSNAAAERQADRLAQVHAFKGEMHQVIVYGYAGLVTSSRVGFGRPAPRRVGC